MPRILCAALLACTIAAATACTSDATPTAMTGQCQGKRPLAEPDPIRPDVVALILEPEVQRGTSIPFIWPNPPLDTLSADDFVVQCWTSKGWRTAWIELGAFALDGEPELLKEVWKTDPTIKLPTDMHPESAGVLIIPANAPLGWYRFQLIRSSGGLSLDATTGEARFQIRP